MVSQKARLSQAPTYTDKKARPFSKKLPPTKSAVLPYKIPKAASNKKLYAAKNHAQQKATFLTIQPPAHSRIFMSGDSIFIPSPKSTTTKKGVHQRSRNSQFRSPIAHLEPDTLILFTSGIE